MADPSVTFFPVGNGDTALILLSDSSSILIDCNIVEESEDDEESRYDVHDHLLNILKKVDRIPHLDAFILTHPDEDHCRGIDKVFYVGDPNKYSESDKNGGLVIIDELWFTPRIFSEYTGDLCDYAKIIKKEAERRIDLFRSSDQMKYKAGNRIRVIGYSDNPDLEGLESIITTPGNTINLINNDLKDDFYLFVHAPFKDDDEDNSDRNTTSGVLQACFDVDGENRGWSCYLWG